MDNIFIAQAQKFANAVEFFTLCKAPVWDEEKCRAMGYEGVKAAVVLEGTGVGALDDRTILLDNGYGKEFILPGMTSTLGVSAEPYASWLLCFYEA